MTLYTKSIQQPKESADGIRICIMRRVKPEFVFDLWIPSLAPSTELLKKYHDNNLPWEEYEKEFTQEVLKEENIYLNIVADIAAKYPVTLLCWEETPEKCHRRLVANYFVQKVPTQDVKIA